jgi:hypothetical protein
MRKQAPACVIAITMPHAPIARIVPKLHRTNPCRIRAKWTAGQKPCQKAPGAVKNMPLQLACQSKRSLRKVYLQVLCQHYATFGYFASNMPKNKKERILLLFKFLFTTATKPTIFKLNV